MTTAAESTSNRRPLLIPILYGHRYDGAIKPLLILLPGLLMMAL
jgi:hypothetical protein